MANLSTNRRRTLPITQQIEEKQGQPVHKKEVQMLPINQPIEDKHGQTISKHKTNTTKESANTVNVNIIKICAQNINKICALNIIKICALNIIKFVP